MILLSIFSSCLEGYNKNHDVAPLVRMAENKLIKPYLKWAGGKRQLLPILETNMPNFKGRYYEPFVGAGALLFDKKPKKATINDLNTQLMLTYKVIQNNVEELIELLQKHKDNNLKYGSKYYYEIREMDRDSTFPTLKDEEKAARLIYLNKTCYNGLYRVNSQGLFNTPYGRYKNPSICEKEVLRAISDYFSKINIEILNVDFESAVEGADKNDFVYFDPPYHTEETNFTGYQASGFDEEEQTRLRDCILNLTERKVKCLLSNSNTSFIRELYKEKPFKISTVNATRMINSDASGRGKVEEVLVKNW